MSGADFQAHDIVRLTREMFDTPPGSEGEVIGRYVNDPLKVVVRLWDGGVQRVPTDALELVERIATAQPLF